jgi:hypothetical protein
MGGIPGIKKFLGGTSGIYRKKKPTKERKAGNNDPAQPTTTRDDDPANRQDPIMRV